MSQTVQINLTTNSEALNTIKNVFLKSTTVPKVEMLSVLNYLEGCVAGEYAMKMDIQVNNGTAVAATGTVTFSAASTANDTFLINGITLTATSGTPTNNQWKVSGTTATDQAAKFVTAVNASSTSLVSGQVTASNVAGVVTFTSNFVSIAGNAVTIAKGTDGGSVMTVSGARLTGGAAITANVYKYGL